MKKYQFIKRWMNGGKLPVSKSCETFMINKEGRDMDFRQISEW